MSNKDINKCTSYDLTEWDHPLVLSTKNLVEPEGSEVLIKVTAAGLCHSDLHIKKGYMDLGEQGKLTFAERGAVLPMTLGHEIAGVVEKVGDLVQTVKIGQQVLVFPWVGCGKCLACLDNRESDCESMRIIGLKQNGGFASHCLIENESLLIDIDGLDSSEVVSHACAGLTVYNALEKLGPLRDHEWLAILGCGGLGLNAISIAAAMGFKNIIALDIDPQKLETAKAMGATKTFNNSEANESDKLKQITKHCLMAILDTHGSTNSANIAVRALAKAGTYLVVGQAGGDFKIPLIWLPQKAMTVRGSHVGNSTQLRKLINMVREKKIKQIPIERRSLSHINQAITDLESGKVNGRIVFNPDTSQDLAG